MGAFGNFSGFGFWGLLGFGAQSFEPLDEGLGSASGLPDSVLSLGFESHGLALIRAWSLGDRLPALVCVFFFKCSGCTEQGDRC